MNDIEITIVIAFLSYFLNMMNIHYEINPYTFILLLIYVVYIISIRIFMLILQLDTEIKYYFLINF